MRFSLQICCSRKRTILVNIQRNVSKNHLAGAPKHPGGAHKSRPRPQSQSHRPPKRRRLRKLNRCSIKRRFPNRHSRFHDPTHQIPKRKWISIHCQHLPLHKPLHRLQFFDVICVLRRKHSFGERRRHHLHKYVRCQLRYPRLGHTKEWIHKYGNHSG